MIKINELRTGNLFLYDIGVDSDGVGTEWQPTALDWQDIKWCGEDPKGFNLVHSPIPLTEEWLLRFGFENDPSDYQWIFKDKFCIDYFQDEEGFWFLPSNRIYTVHQLQNLYHALYGEEL